MEDFLGLRFMIKMSIKEEILDSLEGKARCIQCRETFWSEGRTAKWCSMECKGKTFDEYFRNSQWVDGIKDKMRRRFEQDESE